MTNWLLKPPMFVIAIDTSGRKGSVALCRVRADTLEVLQTASLDGGSYSAKLMPAIASLIEQNLLDKNAVEAFVVVSGPGSFTGLRVGLATVKGLCEGLRKPLVMVSMLEAIAITHGLAGQIATAVLDAGRGEVYIGKYRISSSGDGATLLSEHLVKLADFALQATNMSSEILTPDSALADAIQAETQKVRLVTPVEAGEIGRIGLHKLLAGDVADIATVDVNYIRRSDAELFSTPKR
jgi:tRNA threonylcarbamoyladenosine biosynthesis protein TsaB